MPDLKLFIIDENTGRFRLGLPSPPETVEGIDLLVQIVAMLFLNNGGRSIFQPGRSGGLRRYIGQNFDQEDPSELFADFRLITNRIEQIIKEEQVLIGRPASERLQSLQLVDIVPDEDQAEIELIVSVVNEEQQQQQAIVAV